MSELIFLHKEGLRLKLEEIFTENPHLAVGLMGIGTITLGSGRDRFEVRLSGKMTSEVRNVLPFSFADFTINYETIDSVDLE